jgi:uncharacterized membrane protein YedE/YeeE
VSGIASGVFSIILPYIYNADKGNLRAKTGFVMAGFAAVGMVATWLAVPEMKGRSPMEIDRMFALKLPTRSFEQWRSDVALEKDTVTVDQDARP